MSLAISYAETLPKNKDEERQKMPGKTKVENSIGCMALLPPEIHMRKPYPHNVMVFGGGAFWEIIKFR